MRKFTTLVILILFGLSAFGTHDYKITIDEAEYDSGSECPQLTVGSKTIDVCSKTTTVYTLSSDDIITTYSALQVLVSKSGKGGEDKQTTTGTIATNVVKKQYTTFGTYWTLYWSPDGLDLTASPTSGSYLDYDKSVTLTPTSDGYTGSYRFFVTNSETSSSEELIKSSTGAITLSLDDVMDAADELNIVGNNDYIKVYFRVKFPATDFKNKSKTIGPFYFYKPTVTLDAPSNTICWNDDISLSTNLTENVDWYARTNSNTWELFKEDTAGSIITNINKLKAKGITIDNSTTDFTLDFTARPTGGTYNIAVKKSTDYYPESLPVFSLETTDAACDGKETGIIKINVTSGGTGTLRYGVYPLDDDGNMIDQHAQETQSNSSKTATFSELPGNINYEIQVQNVKTDVTAIKGDTYTESVRCASKATYELGLIGPPEIDSDSSSTTSTTCSYNDDGKLDIALSFEGNGATYSYRIYNSNGDTIRNNSGSFTDLSPGDYGILVVDKEGCKSTTSSLNVPEVDSLTYNATNPYILHEYSPSNLHIKCKGESNGRLTINATGGTTPYYYSSDGGSNYQDDDSITGLSAGTYDLIIKDNNGCLSSIETVELNEADSAVHFWNHAYDTTDFNGYAVSCYGGENGEITPYAGGGSGDLTYSLDNSNYTDDLPLDNLSAGNYTIYVQDQNECQASINLTLSSPTEISPGLSVIPKHHGAGITCVNAAGDESQDGIITYNITGGVPGYYRSWDEGTSLSTNAMDTITGQESGDHSIIITDNNGCTKTQYITVTKPDVIQSEINTYTTPVCYDDTTGTLTVKGLNGLAPYSFSINDGDFVSDSSDTYTFTNLHADTYTITARDANYNAYNTYNTCIGSTYLTLIEKERVEVDFSVVTPFCNGDAGNILTTIESGPGDSTNYSYEWTEDGSISVISTDSNLYNQSQGTYQLTVYDEESCPRLFTDLTITEPIALEFTSIIANSTTCGEINNASITINKNNGGTDPCEYSIDGGSTFQYEAFFDSLSAGVYDIVIMDANGCQIDSSITIEDGEVFVNIDSIEMVSCNTFEDGFIQVSGTGGQGVYEYSIDNGTTYSTLNEFSLLSAGTYYVIASDVSTGCNSSVDTVDLTEPDQLIVTALLVDSAACGQAIGQVDQIISGGSGNFDTAWYVIGSSVPLTISDGLTSGQYVVKVSDLNSSECTSSDTLFVPEREAPEITELNILDQPWCQKPLGSVQVVASGGSPAYTYQWNDRLPQTSPTATSLYADIEYSITVTDKYNCTDDTTITLKDGPAINITDTSVDAACGQNNGSTTLYVTGGVSPYKYKWNDSIAVDTLLTNTMDNLYAGEYTIYISDSVGCIQDYSLDISNIGAPSIDVVKVQKSYCQLNTGLAIISASGGVPDYSYKWTATGDTATISSDTAATNLYAGDYRIKVSDTKNCIAYENITIIDSVELEPNIDIVSVSPSACDKYLGSASVLMSEGLAPYSYLWSTGDTDATAYNLHNGDYTVTGTDARGCVVDTVVTITDKPDPQIWFIEQTASACGKALGTITVGIEEGTSPYYCFSNNSDSETFDFELNPVSGNYEATVTSLAATSTPYMVTAIDSNGCYSDTAEAVISDAVDMTIHMVSIEAVSCYGGSDGQAEITVTNGTAPYSYSWTGNDDDSTYTDELSANSNTVTVTDSNGCSVEKSFEIPTPDSIQLLYIEKTEPGCYGGSDGAISITAGGGNQPYSYLWNNGQTSSIASDISAGIHKVVISDANGCTNSRSLVLSQPDKIEDTEVTKDLLLCEGQEVTLDPGDDYISSSWTSSIGFSSVDKTVTVSDAGEYYLEATTINGCIVTDTIVLETSTSLLEAEFLMKSEAYTDDTIALVEVSWPVPDKIEWDLPDEVTQLSSTDDAILIMFADEGYYYVELTAYLSECVDVIGKYIDITESETEDTKSALANKKNNLLNYSLSPNPNRGNFMVNFEFEEDASAVLEIISVTGKIIQRIIIDQEVNEYSLDINMPQLKPGTYLLNLRSGGYNSVKPFIVY